MAACSKKLLKSIESDLQREVELQKARRILQCFSKNGGRGVPTVLAMAAVKTLYKHNRKRSVQKEKKVTERISKYTDVIEENMCALSGLLGDVVADTTSILDTIALDDPEVESDDVEEEEEEEEDDLKFLSALLQPQKRVVDKQPKQKKKVVKAIALPAVPTTKLCSDNEDDSPPGGSGGVVEPAR